MLTKLLILVLIATASAQFTSVKRPYGQKQVFQQIAPVQQEPVPVPAPAPAPVPVPVPAPVPAPLPVPPPIVPPMVMGGGSPIIDLLLLGTLFGGGGFGGFGGGRRGGRYGRDLESIVHEAEALELEEPTSEHEVNIREKRQLGMMGAGLGVPPMGLGVPPIGMPIAPVGGLGITGSPIIDLLVLGQLFGGGDNYRGGRRHRHHDFKRAVDELTQEAEALELEEPTSEHEVSEQTKTGERVKRQLIGGGLLSPLSPMGGSPLIDLLLLGSLYGNGGIFSSGPGPRHHRRN